MCVLIDVAEVATALNVGLLAVLATLWARNFRRFRSKHTLGLTVFAVMLLAENALGLYFYLWDPMMHGWWHEEVPTLAVRAVMVLDLLEFLGVVCLAWVTWD
jgi:CHASE2 domain-containing sensor protein